jgi:hypothetical protein
MLISHIGCQVAWSAVLGIQVLYFTRIKCKRKTHCPTDNQANALPLVERADLPSLTCLLRESDGNLMGITFAISVGSLSSQFYHTSQALWPYQQHGMVLVLILITLSIMLVKYGSLKNALTRAFVRDGTVFLYGIVMIGIISTVLTFTGQVRHLRIFFCYLSNHRHSQESIKWVLGA